MIPLLSFSQSGLPRKILLDKDTVICISQEQMRTANLAYIKSVVYKETLDTIYAEYLNCVEAYHIYKDAYEEADKQVGRISELDARHILEIQDLNKQLKHQKSWGKWKGWLLFGAGGSLMYFIMK